jgi:hypothetical protein
MNRIPKNHEQRFMLDNVINNKTTCFRCIFTHRSKVKDCYMPFQSIHDEPRIGWKALDLDGKGWTLRYVESSSLDRLTIY